MTSLHRSLDGNSNGPRFPSGVDVGGGTRRSCWFFRSGSHGGVGGGGGGGGAIKGGSMGAFRSPWISRLRPPPRPLPGPLFHPAGQRGASAHPVASRLLCRDASASAAGASSSGRVPQQKREAEGELGIGRGEVVDEEGGGQGEGRGMVAGFGPFRVGTKRAGPLLANQQWEHTEWGLVAGKAGCSRGNGRLMADAFPGKGDYSSLARDGCFPFFQRMSRPGVVGEVAERDGDKGLVLEDEGGGVLRSLDTGQDDAVNGEGCPLRETSFFPRRGTLDMSPNIRRPSKMGSDNAATSSQVIENNQWLHRHRRGQNSKFLGDRPASSHWPVGSGSIMHPKVSGSSMIDGSSLRMLRDQDIVASKQGAADKEYADDMATTTTFHARHSNEVVQVIQSSFWNIKRVERTRIVSSLRPPLALDKGVGRKRILDPDISVPPRSQKLRILD